MNIHNIKNPVDKILRRLETLDEGKELHELDRQFLTRQLQEAYNALHDSSPAPAEPEEEPHPGKNSIFEFDEEAVSADRPADSPTPPEPKSEKKPQARQTPAPQEVEMEVVEQEKEVKPAEKPEPPQSAYTPSEAPVSTSTADYEEDIEALFQIKESTELSERLSRLPIDDIWAAMGLNERIFTQNELFQGQAEVFKSTVQKLNQCNSFAEAKKLLAEGPVQSYEWVAPDRKKIAKNFIRLVKRKYS
jgi:outer membrane biosynthesis protein TonB